MNNKLNEYLKNYLPPKIDLEHNKNKLRRALLNSDMFEMWKWYYKFGLKEITITVTFSILLITILFYSWKNNEDKLNERINWIDKSYAGFLAPNSNNYSDSKLRIYGIDNEYLDLKIEKTINHKENKYSILIKDFNSNELLDKIIIKNEKVYRMKNPKLQILNTAYNNMKLIIEITEDFINCDELNKDSIYIHLKNSFGNHSDSMKETGLLVYNKTNVLENELDIENSELHSMKVSRQLNFDEYLKDNPINLLKELKESSNITLNENYYDKLTGQNFYMIQIVDSTNYSTKLKLNSGKALIDSLKKTYLKDSINFFSYHYNTFENNKLPDTSGYTIPAKVKTILINQQTNKIEGVNYSIRNDKKSTLLSSVRFTTQKLAQLDKKIFDPALSGLEYFGSTKKVEKTIIKRNKHYDPTID